MLSQLYSSAVQFVSKPKLNTRHVRGGLVALGTGGTVAQLTYKPLNSAEQ